MAEMLHKAWEVIVGWFHPDMAHGVFWGSLLVTFVASVMGKDQQQRLDQGKFGLAAGTSLGGLSGLLTNQSGLVVVGFVGSAVGGLLGWLYYMLLTSLVVRDTTLRNLVTFQVRGLEGLQEELDVQSKQNLKKGFDDWSGKFTQLLGSQKSFLLRRCGTAGWEDHAVGVIRSWLVSAVDTLALVFGTLTDRLRYQSRVSIIVYGRASDTNAIVGRHWIHYEGHVVPFQTQDFTEKSIGYLVLSKQVESPYVTNTKELVTKGQIRSNSENNRANSENRPFVTFRLNDNSILTVDWPEEIEGSDEKPQQEKKNAGEQRGKEADPYIQAAKRLFYEHITRAVADLLDSWPGPLASVVDLKPLKASSPQPGTKEAIPSAPGSSATVLPSSPLAAVHPNTDNKQATPAVNGTEAAATEKPVAATD